MIADEAVRDVADPIKGGFPKRVGLALYEWYTGACPNED